MMPPIRKVAPGLIAQSIVSVQPMTQPVGGAAFYKATYGKREEDLIGKEIFFKVNSITTLLWLLSQAAEDPTKNRFGEDWNAKKWLIGFGPNGERCTEFHSEDFRVENGLGRVQTGGGLEIEHLKSNEGYEEFLLSLYWQSAFGWPTEMHVLGLAAYDGVEMATRETV